MTKNLTWDDLVPYERQQGGYWDHSTCTDVYGNGKTWVPVRNPAMASEPIATTVVQYECPHCTQHYSERQKSVEHIAQCFRNSVLRTVELAEGAKR